MIGFVRLELARAKDARKGKIRVFVQHRGEPRRDLGSMKALTIVPAKVAIDLHVRPSPKLIDRGQDLERRDIDEGQ